jgi:hypothetical protein
VVERARERGHGSGVHTQRWLAGLATGAALALSFAAPAAAQGPPADAASPFDAWLDTQKDALARRCDRRATQVDGERTLVACGASGLWVVERAATGAYAVVAVQDLGGDVVGLFAREGRVWAEVARLEARPVLRGSGSTSAFPTEPPPSGPSTATPPQRPAKAPARAPAPVSVAPAREGHVIELGAGEVVVDLGRSDGVKPGDRVELAVSVTEMVGGQVAANREVVAVGVVRTVAPDYSRVTLGINEKVPLSASARLVARNKSESRVAPPRAAGLWELGLRLRPFVALDGLGGGLLAQASAFYRFETHLAIGAELHPFGFADGSGVDKITSVPAASFLSVAYDRDVFSIGVGLGVQTVHDVDFLTESGTGTLLTQRLRLGARDGLNLDLRNDVVLFHSRFDFSGFVGSAMVPVGSRAWLLFEGGGGSAGWAYGELGLRSLLRGNGQRGSVFLSVTLGGQAVFENARKTCSDGIVSFQCPNDQFYAGPMLGVGGEYRF